jgi:hypothetical protein
MAEYCPDGRYKIYRPPIWVPTGRYRAKAGRYIAVGNTGSLTVEQKADLYNNKASNLLFVNSVSEANTLADPPYNIPKSQMIAGMSPPISNLTPWLDANIKRFNVDEPTSWHKNFGYEFIDQVDAQLPADGKLYVSEYYHKSCYWFGAGHENTSARHDAVSNLVSQYAPLVSTKTKFGTHSKWEVADFPWGTDTVTDPRDQWTHIERFASEPR